MVFLVSAGKCSDSVLQQVVTTFLYVLPMSLLTFTSNFMLYNLCSWDSIIK